MYARGLANVGFEVFSPVSRVGSYESRTGDNVPPERFGEVVKRWWRKGERRFSEVTHRCGTHLWSFRDLWTKMHQELGFGIPSQPY